MSTPSKVFILYTGGTIGMAPSVVSNPASPLVPQPLEELIMGSKLERWSCYKR